MAGRALTASDEEIVRRFQETGDTECFAELFVRNRKKVFFKCRGFFSNGQGAEDATQETFLRAYRNIHSFHGGDFPGWLMRIARNVCIDEWRRSRPEQGIGDAEFTEAPATLAFASPFEGQLAVERVWREMRSLSPEQQRCLKLKIEGYSYEETAARTGFSIEAVKSHLQNGRRMLWRRMEGALALSK
jgi:RNA polymerase sigma-70 factor (ECF subfamily)